MEEDEEGYGSGLTLTHPPPWRVAALSVFARHLSLRDHLIDRSSLMGARSAATSRLATSARAAAGR